MPKFIEKWMPELFIIVLLMLVAIGVLMTYSSSVYYAEIKFGNKFHFFYREIFWIIIGFISAIIVARVHYQTIQKYSGLILLIATIGLALVYLPYIGHKVNNATRWIRILGFTFQPSEFAKYAIIIFIADKLAVNRRHVHKFYKGVILPLIIIIVPVAMILAEPDLGTPLVIMITVITLFFVAGTKIWHLITLGVFSLPVIALFIYKFPYRIKRLLTFINPDSDPLGAGFQIRQSLIAIGSGQLNGVGLGKSIQKMHYLPEAHTDFVFSIIGEELGFVGAASIILLMLLFIFIIYKLTQQINDMFGHLVAVGIMTILSIQMIINILVVTALLPTKGLALPFISYGGSSMVTTLAACGLLINIVINRKNLRCNEIKRVKFDETVI